MKKILIILGLYLLSSQLALAQSQRNPCIYLNTLNNNCQPVGSSTNGVGNSPMPVGGLATAAAPVFVEGMVGGLSFDLSGNLRTTSSGGGGAVTIANGADVAEGATTDAATTAGGIGTVSAKLRLITTQLGTINTTLGSPFQVGGSIANTAFGISGTLPAYAATPTFNCGTGCFQTTQPISGTVTANQGSANATPWPVSLTSTTITGTVAVTQSTSPWVVSNGGTFPVQATLNAETTKVIGTVNQGTSPWVVSGTVIGSAGLGITPTDRTITSASGSSQQIMAANASRHSLTIENTGNANCGINPTGGTAVIGGAGTITLVSLGSYTPRIPTLSAVTVICTSGQPIYGDEN